MFCLLGSISNGGCKHRNATHALVKRDTNTRLLFRKLRIEVGEENWLKKNMLCMKSRERVFQELFAPRGRPWCSYGLWINNVNGHADVISTLVSLIDNNMMFIVLNLNEFRGLQQTYIILPLSKTRIFSHRDFILFYQSVFSDVLFRSSKSSLWFLVLII